MSRADSARTVPERGHSSSGYVASGFVASGFARNATCGGGRVLAHLSFSACCGIAATPKSARLRSGEASRGEIAPVCDVTWRTAKQAKRKNRAKHTAISTQAQNRVRSPCLLEHLCQVALNTKADWLQAAASWPTPNVSRTTCSKRKARAAAGSIPLPEDPYSPPPSKGGR
eukprot:1780782-Pleurochrysis_carterae.AAC.1